MMMCQKEAKRQRQPGVLTSTHGEELNRFVGVRGDATSNRWKGFKGVVVRMSSRQLSENNTRESMPGEVDTVNLQNMGIATQYPNSLQVCEGFLVSLEELRARQWQQRWWRRTCFYICDYAWPTDVATTRFGKYRAGDTATWGAAPRTAGDKGGRKRRRGVAMGRDKIRRHAKVRIHHDLPCRALGSHHGCFLKLHARRLSVITHHTEGIHVGFVFREHDATPFVAQVQRKAYST